MNKNVRIKFTEKAEAIYQQLLAKSKSSKESRMILNAVDHKIEIIKLNPFYGDQIKKPMIPTEYLNAYEASNLFRVELPCFWRMIYTVTSNEDEIEILALVLDIFDHEDYDRKFGYRGL